MGYSPWDPKESDMTEQLTLSHYINPLSVIILPLQYWALAVGTEWTEGVVPQARTNPQAGVPLSLNALTTCILLNGHDLPCTFLALTAVLVTGSYYVLVITSLPPSFPLSFFLCSHILKIISIVSICL